MAERDLIHATAQMLGAASDRPHRVILPVAALGTTDPTQPLGTNILRVEAAASGIRAELNASAPEVATWWSAPTFWLDHHAPDQPGSSGLPAETYRDALGGAISSFLSWAHQVIVVTTAQHAEVLDGLIGTLRSGGENVIWVSVEQGPDAIYDAADAIRFQQPGATGRIVPESPSQN